MGVPEGVPYLPAIVQEYGYLTLAVTASSIFRRARPQEEYDTVTDFEHAGLVRQQQVRSLDVTPTTLDYLGIPRARYPLQGRSLRDVVERDAPRDEPSFAWIGNIVSPGATSSERVSTCMAGPTRRWPLLVIQPTRFPQAAQLLDSVA